MSDDTVNIEVNGVPLKARKGQMIMQVTDPAHIYIPRFCYHDKLTVAANCRMCLVEVEKAPKPLPACATPVTEGMKVFTKSPKAVAAQRATMEFLLINHPLDCPICDQGGECELQDLALGYGRDISRFSERKRVVKDKNLGPLVSTDMTRCIHCTRCVRFGQEIQGYPQMGTTGRGEHMEVGTYIEHSVDHELSANIIDLCPVGALNNKPFRYHARAWEMTQQPLVSPHDAFGTNLYAHVLRGKLMRMVPRENEEINETWIADRDRFGFEGMYSADRVSQPMLRIDGALQVGGLGSGADRGRGGPAESGGRSAAQPPRDSWARRWPRSRSCTCSPELRGARAAPTSIIACASWIFARSNSDAAFPSLGLKIADVERLDGVLVIGSNLRHEVPMLAHRIRKAAIRTSGAKVGFLNPRRFDYMFPVAAYALAETDLVGELAARGACRGGGGQQAGAGGRRRRGDQRFAPRAGRRADERHAPCRHPRHAGAAAPGLLAAQGAGGDAGGAVRRERGLHHRGRQRGGGVPGGRGAAPRAGRRTGRRGRPVGARHAGVRSQGLCAVRRHRSGVRLWRRCARARPRPNWWSPSPRICRKACARSVHVVLPIGSFAETSGTFVNAEGRWQSWAGAAKLPGESRPGWKVLRVLANLLNLHGVDYVSSEEIRDALRISCGERVAATSSGVGAAAMPEGPKPVGSWVDIPPYQCDALVRGSEALAKTKDGRMTRTVI